MILEIEHLFSDRANLSANIKMIKELTNVLKELEKLHDEQKTVKSEIEEQDKKKFFEALIGLSTIQGNKTKK